jgi:hypothetical protein
VRFLQRSAFFCVGSQSSTDFLLRCRPTTTRGGVMHQSTWVVLLLLMAGEIAILAIGGFVLWLVGEFGDVPYAAEGSQSTVTVGPASGAFALGARRRDDGPAIRSRGCRPGRSWPWAAQVPDGELSIVGFRRTIARLKKNSVGLADTPPRPCQSAGRLRSPRRRYLPSSRRTASAELPTRAMTDARRSFETPSSLVQ